MSYRTTLTVSKADLATTNAITTAVGPYTVQFCFKRDRLRRHQDKPYVTPVCYKGDTVVGKISPTDGLYAITTFWLPNGDIVTVDIDLID